MEEESGFVVGGEYSYTAIQSTSNVCTGDVAGLMQACKVKMRN